MKRRPRALATVSVPAANAAATSLAASVIPWRQPLAGAMDISRHGLSCGLASAAARHRTSAVEAKAFSGGGNDLSRYGTF